MTAARRVLVTGASGFIGFHCLAPLAQHGHEVVGVYRNRKPPALAGVTYVQSDLLQVDEARRLIDDVRPDRLLHLAWYVEPGKMISHGDNIAWVAASIRLLEAFQQSGGSRCVAGGSCYEYDWRYGCCVEDLTPRTPDTVYGLAKNSFGDALQAFALATGLSSAWARMFFLYGPHENPRRLVPSIVLSLLKGEAAKSSHGEQLRDYAHVQDVAEGLVALLESECTGSYNVATGNAVSIRSIVEKLGALVGREDLLQIGAIPARANDAPLVVASTAKTNRDVAWRSRIGLDAGLEATVDWWRAQQRPASP